MNPSGLGARLGVFAAAVVVVIAPCASGASSVPCVDQRIVASDPATFDNFAWAVAVSGTTVMIGSFHDDDMGSDSGSVYVFNHTPIWQQVQKILIEDAHAGDNVGGALAMDGQVALIGAPGHQHAPGLGTGAAYIFRFDGAHWVEEQELRASDSAWQDRFGFSLAVHGDVAVIGADLHDPMGVSGAGAAYVFRYNPAKQLWVQDQKLVSPRPQEGGFFGRQVAVRGNLILVGAGEDTISWHAGAAYMFRYEPLSGQWALEQTLLPDPTPPWPAPGSTYGFGISVSLSDAGAMVGASGQFVRGAMYWFEFDGKQWVRTQLIKHPNAWNTAFGSDVVVDGQTMTVAAHNSSPPGYPPQVGAAYAFKYDAAASQWKQSGPALTPPPGGGPLFAFSIALAGETAVIGAYGESSQRGAAYIYDVAPAIGDLNCDEAVNGLDLAALLAAWGPCWLCASDFSGDGLVNGFDLASLLANWGSAR